MPDDTNDAHATGARNARAEARRVVGDGFDARVLEPSPPAVADGPWFADDPANAPAAPARRVVGPVSGADLTWDEWLADRPDLAGWAGARWLGGYRRLPPAPPALTATRLALHRVAFYVVSPARRRANGKIALRWTYGGLGTPFFGADEQVRIVGTGLVRQRGEQAAAEPIRTLARAAEFALDGPPDVEWAAGFDVPAPGPLDADLEVDGDAAAFLGDWYGFSYSVLEQLRADPGSTETSRVQLWPEHFDAAFDEVRSGRKATYGASPGDAAVDEPYLYVLPADFAATPASELWNAQSFRGAILRLSEFVADGDQRGAALTFFRDRRALLTD